MGDQYELQKAVEHDQEHGKWYAYGRAVLGGTDFIHPVEIAGNGNVVCRTGGSQKPVAPDEYLRVHREFAPFRKVGIWDFVPWGDEAADEIRAAHQSPGSAGRQIVRLQKRLAQYERQCIPRTADMPEWAFQWRKADDGTTLYVGWDRPRKRDEGRDYPWLQTVPAPDHCPDETGPVYRHIVDVE